MNKYSRQQWEEPGLTEEQHDLIVDLVRCPGLYAGQYHKIESAPAGFVEYLGSGIENVLGIPHAYPSQKARDYVDENT